MNNKRKVILFIVAGIFALIAILFVLKTILYNQYSSKIPELSESHILSVAVRDQISEAFLKAHRSPTADNLGKLGMVYHSSTNYEQAAQCYELAIKRDPSEWKWNYYLGFLYKEMGNSEAVIANFTSVTDKISTVYHAWYYLGGAYRNLRKTELAEKSLGRITDIHTTSYAVANTGRYDYFPLGTYAMFQLARIYNETGRIELAEKTLKEIIRNMRSFGPAYRLLGNIYSVKGDMEQSKSYGVRANDLVVFSPPVDTLIDRLVLLSKSELYLLKKIDEAERSMYPEWAMQLVNIALESLPENKYLISKAIKISLMLDLDKEAAAYADQHINYFQDNFTELNNMGILFFQKRLYTQSMKYLTRAMVLRPKDVEIQNSLAICYWYMGDKQKSLGILDEVIEENQDNPDVLANVTNLMFDLGEDEKARSHLIRVKQLAPEHPKVQRMFAGIAEQEGNFQEAISLYESSFNNDPEDLSTIRFLGNLLYRQKIWDKYIRYFRTALEHHPNDPYLLERLGTVLVSCPDPAWRNTLEGRDFSERAFIHTTSRSITLVSAGRSLALAYAELGDKQNATTVIHMTINIARRENIAQSYQKELENIARRIQTLKN
jgi:tetratricopeptide (TPR) repeat protein